MNKLHYIPGPEFQTREFYVGPLITKEQVRNEAAVTPVACHFKLVGPDSITGANKKGVFWKPNVHIFN